MNKFLFHNIKIMSDAYILFNLHVIKESDKQIEDLRNKKKSNKL
jgi:hypothetical protein